MLSKMFHENFEKTEKLATSNHFNHCFTSTPNIIAEFLPI